MRKNSLIFFITRDLLREFINNRLVERKIGSKNISDFHGFEQGN